MVPDYECATWRCTVETPTRNLWAAVAEIIYPTCTACGLSAGCECVVEEPEYDPWAETEDEAEPYEDPTWIERAAYFERMKDAEPPRW